MRCGAYGVIIFYCVVWCGAALCSAVQYVGALRCVAVRCVAARWRGVGMDGVGQVGWGGLRMGWVEETVSTSALSIAATSRRKLH